MKVKKYTKAEWQKACDWVQAFLGLQDWDITLFYLSPPPWVDVSRPGMCRNDLAHKQADVWVNVSNCRKNDIDPFAVLFHEFIHLACDDVGMATRNKRAEFLLIRLEKAMLAAYRKGVK